MQRLLRFLKVLRGKDLYVFPDTEIKKITLGNKNAAWTINPSSINNKSIVYSFGVGNDISFDSELINKYGVKVYAFDPTPKSADWLKTQQLPANFYFYQKGLASYDGKAEFALPDNPEHVSATILTKNSKQGYFQADVNTLQTLMKELGHTKIDILKMDIEGAEYDVIENILASNISIAQLLIEFHHRFENVGTIKTKNVIRQLRKAGYMIFDVSASGEEISFIKN